MNTTIKTVWEVRIVRADRATTIGTFQTRGAARAFAAGLASNPPDGTDCVEVVEVFS